MKKLMLAVLFCAAATGLGAKVKLPALMGDGMVLQQRSDANLWGWADPGRKVTVTTSWDGASYTATAAGDGGWLVKVKTPAWGGPYTIDIREGETVTLRNVMIGEVWVCSGQSNMQYRVRGSINQHMENTAETVLSSGRYPQIRSFWVKSGRALEPRQDCTGEWEVSSPGCVGMFSAVAYFFARHLTDALGGVPVGIITASYGGSRIECWMDKPTLDKLPPFKRDSIRLDNPRPQDVPTLFYYGMIAPLTNYTARGFLWYQGESSRAHYKLYPQMQAAMVELWREKWGNPDMPFYYVQIAPYGYKEGTPAALFVEAQVKAQSLIPNSGIVGTTDLGEEKCIHPGRKEPVGQRLALLALSKTYGMSDIPPTGPIYKSVSFEKGKAIVSFDGSATQGVGKMLMPLEGFEIAGADRKFYPAEACVVNRKQMVQVWSDKVPEPVAVRYAFRAFTPGANLSNHYGQPVFPFRSEDWDDIR